MGIILCYLIYSAETHILEIIHIAVKKKCSYLMYIEQRSTNLELTSLHALQQMFYYIQKLFLKCFLWHKMVSSLVGMNQVIRLQT
jgi:hypothetical protein